MDTERMHAFALTVLLAVIVAIGLAAGILASTFPGSDCGRPPVATAIAYVDGEAVPVMIPAWC